MHIVQIITLSEPIGGAQMVLFNNTKAFIDKGHRVTVIVGDKGSLTDRLKAINAQVIILKSLIRPIRLNTDYRCYKELLKLLPSLEPDMVISHSSKAGILTRLACFRKKLPNIFTVHGWSFTPGVKGVKRYLFLVIEKVLGVFSDHLITVSNFDFQLGAKYRIVHKTNMKTIYNGSPDLLKPKVVKNNNKVNLVMTARFSYQKDHETFFKALQQINTNNVVVNLVGSGDLFAHFKNRAKELGLQSIVTFHGESNNIPQFLNEAHVFILTSRFEGLPLSICEAMSAGIPVVASNVGGINEMVQDGYNGYLVPKETVQTLANKLDLIIKDKELRENLGRNARHTFETKFSIEQMAANTEQYINEIRTKKIQA